MATITNNDIAKAIYFGTKDLQGEKLSHALKRSVQILARRRLLGKKEAILKSLEKIVHREEGILRGRLLSAKKLDRDTKHSLHTKLEKKYSVNKVLLDEVTDETLLGGMRIEIGDEVIDLTAKNKLKKLKEHLIK